MSYKRSLNEDVLAEHDTLMTKVLLDKKFQGEYDGWYSIKVLN